MTQFLDTHVDKSLGVTGTWADIDLSSDVPTQATGAVFKVIDTLDADKAFGLRKKGSTDDRYYDLESGAQQFYIVGLDANRVCQGKIENTNTDFWLIGYTEADATMLTNGVDKSLGATGVWTDIDLSANLPAGAVAAIFEVVNTDILSRMFGFRKNGSTDEHYDDTFSTSHRTYIVGVDANRICEGKIEHSNVDFFLIGYLIAGTAETNGVDRSISVLDTYIDITESNAPAGATGVFTAFMTIGPAYSFAARKNGAGDDTFEEAGSRNAIICVGLDANKKWEGKIDTLVHDFYTLGYFAAGVVEKTKTSSIGLGVVAQKTKTSSVGMLICPPIFEDFTTFTEVDIAADRIQKTANHVDHLSWMNETTYLYKDYDIGHFSDFTHKIKLKKAAGGDLLSSSSVWGLTNDLGDFQTLSDAGKNFLHVTLTRGSSLLFIRLYEEYNGAIYSSSFSQTAHEDWRYIKIVKSGTAFSAYIYSDASYSTLLGICNLTLHSQDNYRYLYPVSSIKNGSALSMITDVENFNLGREKTKLSSIGISVRETRTKASSVEIRIIAHKTKASSIGLLVQKTETKTSSTGLRIVEVGTKEKQSSIGLTVFLINRTMRSGLLVFGGISEDGRIEIAAGILEDGTRTFKLLIQKPSTIGLRVVSRKTKTSSIGLNIVTLETKTSSIGLTIKILPIKASSIGLSVIDTFIKASTISMHIVDRKTKPSTIGLRVVSRKTKTSSIGLNIVTLENEKVSIVGLRIIVRKTKSSSIGLAITGSEIKQSCIGIDVSPCFAMEYDSGMLISDGIAEDGRIEIAAGILEDGNFRILAKPVTKTSSIGLDIVIRKTKTSYIGVAIVIYAIKSSSIGLAISEPAAKTSSIGMYIYGSNTKESSIGLTPVDPVLAKGFFYAKLGATALYGVTPENFRISKEINKIPTFEFEIANCDENRAAISTGIEDEFKIYWQHHEVDTLIFTGIINADGIEYVSLDSIEITGYASYVVLSWPFHKHLASGDKETVDKVLSYDGAYVDYTTEANNATINDVDMDFSVVNHALYIGDAQPFWGAQIKYSTKGIRTGEGEIVIEYSKGSGVWATLDALDESDAFTEDPGTYDLVISHPPSDWARDTVNGVKKYWIRYRVASTGYATDPALDQIYIVNVDIYRTYYFDTSARQILLNALEGTEYTMDPTDVCPEDEISLIADYESPLRVVAAIPNALTWTDTDGSKKGYQWWVDDSKKVHIKQRRGTIQPDDITGDMTIFNNHEDYFHLSNRLHGLGPRDGLSQIRSIVQDRASITEHKLREIAVPKEQIGDYIMLRNALEKDIAISKAPMQRIKGSVTTEFWGIRGYEVGDTVTLHQTAWNLDEIQMQIVKAEIGPQRTTLNLGISQEHLEGLKDNMHRRLDLNNVRMHGSTTILQAGPERMNYQRKAANEVYPAKLEIEIPSTVKKIHKVLLSWTIGKYRSSAGGTGGVPAHDHNGWSGNGGGYTGLDTLLDGGFTPQIDEDGAFTPQMIGGIHAHLTETNIQLYYNTADVGVLQDPIAYPDANKVYGGNHRHLKGRTGGADDVALALIPEGVTWHWCDACSFNLYNEIQEKSFAEASHWHQNSGLPTGYTDPNAYVNVFKAALITSIIPYAFSVTSNDELPEHEHDGVPVNPHSHWGVPEPDHVHALATLAKHADHAITPEDLVPVNITYGIHEEVAGTVMELLINGELTGETYEGNQTEIRIDGWLNTGNNTIELQPVVGANKKGGATISASGLLFVEPVKF